MIPTPNLTLILKAILVGSDVCVIPTPNLTLILKAILVGSKGLPEDLNRGGA